MKEYWSVLVEVAVEVEDQMARKEMAVDHNKGAAIHNRLLEVGGHSL